MYLLQAKIKLKKRLVFVWGTFEYICNEISKIRYLELQQLKTFSIKISSPFYLPTK